MLASLLNNYAVRKYEIINSSISKVEQNPLNHFPIYVINLKENKTRRAYIKHLFKKHNINYNLIVVNRFKYETQQERVPKLLEPVIGCILSHMWCLKNAIFKGFEKFIIFEDDIVFHKNFNQLFQRVLEDNSNLNVDLLMLGALDLHLEDGLKGWNESSAIYFPTSNLLGAHANMYSLPFAKEFYFHKLHATEILEFDCEYREFMDKYKIGICIPNLVICELSTTNINHNFSPLVHASRFNTYKKWMPKDFTYYDYEYITIAFIDFVKNEMQIRGNNVATLEEMLELFKTGFRSKHLDYLNDAMVKSGYTLEDVVTIANDSRVDSY
jgi:GR25 family glycosyltransferase involved in LPS biosynthesis